MNEYIEAYVTFTKMQDIKIYANLDHDKKIQSYCLETKSKFIKGRVIILCEDRIIFHIQAHYTTKIQNILNNFKISFTISTNIFSESSKVIVIRRKNHAELIQEMVKIEEVFVHSLE